MSPWIHAARPKTLPAAIAPVLMGSSLAWLDGVFDPLPASICLVFALLMQVGANYANDYYDFVKGADTEERVGPRRAVASGDVTPKAMRNATYAVFGLAFVVGCLLIPYGGWWLVAVGVAAVISGLAYTGGPYPLGYNGLGELFVFLFFGLAAVMLTYYVQAGTFNLASFLLAISAGALSSNILVVNNYRDFATDLKSGKRTLVVRLGRTFGLAEYQALFFLAFLMPLFLWMTRETSSSVLLPILLYPLTIFLRRWLLQAKTAQEFNRVLAGTAGLLVLFAVAQSLGLILAA